MLKSTVDSLSVVVSVGDQHPLLVTVSGGWTPSQSFLSVARAIHYVCMFMHAYEITALTRPPFLCFWHAGMPTKLD